MLSRIVTRATSPDGGISAEVREADEIDVRFARGAYRRYTVNMMAHQLAQLLSAGNTFASTRSRALAAIIDLPSFATTAASLRTYVAYHDLVPENAFAAWPKSVMAQHVTYGKPDPTHRAKMTFQIATDPPDTPLCDPVAEVIVRDRAGRIVSGRSTPVASVLVSLDVLLPPGSDTSKTEVYVVQGHNESPGETPGKSRAKEAHDTNQH